MSERGSFVTGYIYCDKCLEIVKQHLIHKEKFLCSVQIPSWVEEGQDRPLLPIIAGKIGETYEGGEIHAMESLVDEFRGQLCHQIQIAVIPDRGPVAVIVAGENKDKAPWFVAGVWDE